MVDINELTVIDQIYEAGGGSGGIYRVMTAKNRQFVFKEYDERALGRLDVNALSGIVSWRHSLSQQERTYIDARVALPRLKVVKQGRVVGFLMRQAPEEFHRSATDRPAARHAVELCRKRSHCSRPMDFYYEIPHKVAILGHALETVTWLHGHGAVVSDLNLRNILVNTNVRSPRAFFVDSDAFAVDGRSAISGLEPETWQTQSDYDEHDEFTDRAKFALLVQRCLEESPNADPDIAPILSAYMRSSWVSLFEGMWDFDESISSDSLTTLHAGMKRFCSNGKMFYFPPGSDFRQPWQVGEMLVTGSTDSSDSKDEDLSALVSSTIQYLQSTGAGSNSANSSGGTNTFRGTPNASQSASQPVSQTAAPATGANLVPPIPVSKSTTTHIGTATSGRLGSTTGPQASPPRGRTRRVAWTIVWLALIAAVLYGIYKYLVG